MTKLEKAIEIAYYAHFGQKDKGGKEYIFHPLFVAFQMKTEEEKIVAILHDVLEDTNYPLYKIEEEFGEKIAKAIVAITRNKDEKYKDYIKRVSKNDIAIKVKIADLKHNMDITRLPSDKVSESLLERYKKALFFLESQLDKS